MHNTELTNDRIAKAMTKLEEAMAILLEAVDGVETTKLEIYEIEKYRSNSGNTTWRGRCEDDFVIYLRQSQKPMLVKYGIWDWLNGFEFNSISSVKIEIETVPDGDFLKVVNIGSWSSLLEV